MVRIASTGSSIQARIPQAECSARPNRSSCCIFTGDFAATLYYLMGIDEETVLFDRLERPQQLIGGKKIGGVLA